MSKTIQWLRLWHDMPSDPKWRTIARLSGRPLPEVISLAVTLMVHASANATERGRTQTNAEDLASGLDLQTEHVAAILGAMEGRVLEGGRFINWEKRQPKREDGSAERSKAWRDERKAGQQPERNRTQPNATDAQEKEKEEEKRVGGARARVSLDDLTLEHIRPWLDQHQPPGFDAHRALDKCRDHFRLKGEKRTDWPATLRNWLRTDFADFTAKQPKPQQGGRQWG